MERYWSKVPKYYIDQDQEPENMKGVDYINTCADLSMLNRSKGAGVCDGSDAKMNKWMFKSAEYALERIKPKVMWGENVHSLFTQTGQGVVDRLRKLGAEHGYSFSIIKTNTFLHGIPQSRIRTFYFFWNTPTVPQLTWKNAMWRNKSISDYLKEIPQNATLQDMFMTRGKVSERFRPYQFVLEREGLTHGEFREKHKTKSGFTISQYLDRNNLEQECIDWLEKYYPNETFAQKANARTHIEYVQHCMNKKAMGKSYWDDSPRFFDKSCGPLMYNTMFAMVHPDEDRFLNAREMMHLMGMPHDFEIDAVKNIKHIAENVPVHTAKDWADEVKLFCEGKLKMTKYSFMKQDNTTHTIISTDGCDLATIAATPAKDLGLVKVLMKQ